MVPSHFGAKKRKPARITPPAIQRRYEMPLDHLIFLPLMVVILEVKVKVIWTIVRKTR
jgi:hypothetical protein